jgi:hypothetical protein
MEMQQTHYYTTGTATLPWKCNMVHRSCYQGKPNMSQYDDNNNNNNNTAMGSVHARSDTFLTFGLKALTETNTSRLATGTE